RHFLEYQIVNNTFLTNGIFSQLRFTRGLEDPQFSFPVTRDETTYVVLNDGRFMLDYMKEQAAQYLGGHLVTIDDQAENTFLKDYIYTNSLTRVRIGLTDVT